MGRRPCRGLECQAQVLGPCPSGTEESQEDLEQGRGRGTSEHRETPSEAEWWVVSPLSLTWRLVRGSSRAEQKHEQKAGCVTVRVEEGDVGRSG